MALPGRRERPRAPGADDERAQRRRPRRQRDRLPGVHDRPGRRARASARGCGWGRGVPHVEEDAARPRAARPRSATRAGSRPTSSPTRRRSGCWSTAIRAAGYVPGDQVAIALDPAVSELFKDGSYVLEHEGRTLTAERAGRLLGRAGRPLPDHLARGRDGRGGLGRVGGADRAPRRAGSSSSATTCS